MTRRGTHRAHVPQTHKMAPRSMGQTSTTRMTPGRFAELTGGYPAVRLAIVGDICLDRYLHIDGSRTETSIETGLPVHNIVKVRPQPGAVGTIAANGAALGVGELHLIGFRGDDGEGYELERELRRLDHVHLDGLICTPDRRTFVYTKPMMSEAGEPLRELNRLDQKNWDPTPRSLHDALADHVRRIAPLVDAMILMDQVDQADTGVIGAPVLAAASEAALAGTPTIVFADSRRGVGGFPPMGFKMNEVEFQRWTNDTSPVTTDRVEHQVAQVNQRLIVTLAERGIVGAAPGEPAHHEPALPTTGPIDIVGAGDSVLANLTIALAAGATLAEAMQLAMAAASVVVHQLGTTGTATVAHIADRLKLN
jgi:bifunctional ADP-heptose synthase (sugar kinase/adenylyltransferase)